MARPGKAIFDVTMMAGWAFAAVLTGLVALTVVDETGDSAEGSSVVATLDNSDSRLVTGSVPAQATQQGDLVGQQNQSFDPFDDRNQLQDDQIGQVMAELRTLKQEVAAFHVSTKRLRNENTLLKQRIAKLELGEESDVRVIELPKRDETIRPIVLHRVDTNSEVDPQATGSIAPQTTIQSDPEPRKQVQRFNPFARSPASQASVKISQEPLTMDVAVEGSGESIFLPRVKPDKASTADTQPEVLDPASVVIPTPTQVAKESAGSLEGQGGANSRTSFGVDLGSFVSLTDLGSAWREVSISQRSIVGDLKPLSRVSQGNNGRLALNLVLGPLQNAADAASLCAQLKYAGYECNVGVYQGQALALR